MIIADAGCMQMISGMSRAMPLTGPMPGRKPIRVPTNRPTKASKRLSGWSATPKPSARLWKISLIGADHSSRQPQKADREPEIERAIEEEPQAQRDAQSDPDRPVPGALAEPQMRQAEVE